jgi:hypothetical protein
VFVKLYTFYKDRPTNALSCKFLYSIMHGIGTQIVTPQQAKLTIRYKTTKLKLLKTSAAVWFNKMCRDKHLTPKCISIKINGHNRQAQHTKAAATRIRINQEINFMYLKKKKIHLSAFVGLSLYIR